MKLTRLIKEIDEANYDQMFDPKTMGNLNRKTTQSRQDMLGNKSMMQAAMAQSSFLNQVISSETGYIDELEPLAIQIVKDAYPIIDYAGIEIDAKIVPFAGVQEMPEEGTPIEDAEGPEFDEIKRRIINAISQGGSIRGAFNYMLFQDYINEIDPTLIQKYNELMKITFGLFDDDEALAMFLAMLAQQNKMEGGSEEVDWTDNGTLTIHARAVCFPMLVHEIVKGLYEILSLQGFGANKERNKQVVKNVDKIANEPEDMRYGKFIYDALTTVFNNSNYDDPRIRELFFTEIYKLDDHQFKLFIDNAINDELTSSQLRWADSVISQIDKDLKADDAGV
jgi:hypothetical protein